MPTLKQLTCTIEWSGSNLPLEEYGTTYADGYVETYIAVPESPAPFSVHLKSSGYIAPGLAMFVYMDGVYQCNRNRQNLRIPDENTKKKQTEVSFRVRQKEERMPDGGFQGRQWRFEKVNIVQDREVEESRKAPYDGEYVGTIEVVVLRCYPASRPGLPRMPTPSSDEATDDEEVPPLTGAMFDGASRRKTVQFGLDGVDESSSAENPSRRTLKAGSTKTDVSSTSSSKSDLGSNTSLGSYSDPAFQSDPWHNTIPLSHYRSDWDASNPELSSERGRSCQPHPFKDFRASPILNLRGGAPGSYEPSPDNSTRSKVTHQTWEPVKTDDWDQPKENSDEPKPWDPVSNPSEKRDAWGELITEDENGDEGGRSAWDTPKDDTTGDNNGWDNDKKWGATDDQDSSWERKDDTDEKRNAWENTGNGDDELQNDWTADNGDNDRKNDSWDSGNNDGEKKEDSWDTNNDTQNTSWDTNNNDTQKATWDTAAVDDIPNTTWPTTQDPSPGPETTAGATSPQKDSPKQTEWTGLTFGNSKGKPSKKSFKPSEAVKSPKTSLTSKFRKPFTLLNLSKADNDVDAPPLRLPGQWSPPLEKKQEKEVSPSPHATSHSPPTQLSSPTPHSIPQKPAAKAYWAAWKSLAPPSPSPSSPLSNVYTLPTSLTTKPTPTHQIHPLPPHTYTHRLATPRYMDSHEDAYAVFVFRYRDKGVVERVCKTRVVERGVERLEGMTREELVGLVLGGERGSSGKEKVGEKEKEKGGVGWGGWDSGTDGKDKNDSSGFFDRDGGSKDNSDRNGNGNGNADDTWNQGAQENNDSSWDSSNQNNDSSWDDDNKNDSSSWDNNNNKNDNPTNRPGAWDVPPPTKTTNDKDTTSWDRPSGQETDNSAPVAGGWDTTPAPAPTAESWNNPPTNKEDNRAGSGWSGGATSWDAPSGPSNSGGTSGW